MISLEQQYYENDAFWNPSNTSSQDEARIQRVIDAISPETRSVLDVGCGNGICCNRLPKLRDELDRVVGFDRSEEAIKYVTGEKAIGDIRNLPFGDQEFDTSLALEVIEHLPLAIYHAALIEIVRVTRKQILISVPARENLDRNTARCPRCRTKFNRNLHMRTFDALTMQNLFERAGFHCQTLQALNVPTYAGAGALATIRGRVRGERYAMRQSLCPVCGYSDSQAREASSRTEQRGWKSMVKRVWPRREKLRWYLASYERQ